MPFVHIRSLPQAPDFDVGEAVRAISREFAASTDTDEHHVTVTWETLAPDHYAHAGRTATDQPAGSHPVLVEVFAPDFNRQEKVEQMLRAAASAIANHAGVPPENVFAEFRPAQSGHVLDSGDLVRW